MASSPSVRRPGIVFETVPTPPPTTLPRMDIAGFVGFAARGPLNVPVPVEDANRFADVFGPPLELMTDPETGRVQRSHLAAAVAAFFENGGRRCWVVRVADGPARRWFTVPGLVDARTGTPAVARARSLGSGFDELRVSTVLRRRRLADAALSRSGSVWSLEWTVRPEDLRPGTLVRVAFADDPVREELEFYGSVEVVQEPVAPAEAPISLGGPNGARVLFDEVFGYRTRPTASLPGGPGLPADVHAIDGAAALPAEAGGAAAPVYRARISRRGGTLRVRFEDAVPAPDPGDVLRADLDDGRRLWLRVRLARSGSASVIPPGTATLVEASAERWPVDPAEILADGDQLEGGLLPEVVNFDLLTWRGDDVHQRLSRLDLTAAAQRSWLRLPTDDALFAVADGEAVPPEPGSLAAEVFEERFALAGPPAPPPSEPSPAFVPFAMPDRPDSSAARAPLLTEHSSLERDGLDRFENALFLDPELTGATTNSLQRRASDRLLVDRAPTRGVHALWSVREVTLLSVPDAVHRGWRRTRVEAPSETVPAPEGLSAAPCSNDETLLCVDWDPVEPPAAARPESDTPIPVRYELEESPAPTFEVARLRYEGPDRHVERPITESCPTRLYLRVRALVGERTGLWSRTIGPVVPPVDFRPSRDILAAPELRQESGSRDAEPVLRWDRVPQDSSGEGPTGSPPEPPEVVYDLQRASDPAFETAVDVPEVAIRPLGEETLEHTQTRGSETLYFRVRARRTAEAGPGPWSNTAVLAPAALPQLAPVRPTEFDAPTSSTPNRGRDGLLDLHRSVLRFCAARGDVVAALALPEHDRRAEAREHLTRLTRRGAAVSVDAIGPLDILPLGVEEDRTLSYGALYHPWPRIAIADRETSVHPPGGEACGLMAARALGRGAWIAPANVVLQGVIGIRPALSPSSSDALLEAGVNVLTLGPRGVSPRAADTLAPDPALAPIGTRRLLILLRRLAERAGPDLVFESHTPALRRRAARLFERVLADLFRRGAFAGVTARDAYRVVADASVNTPERVERGQLVVEVKVAPARPLEFIVIRMLQRGTQTEVAEMR